MRITFSLLLVLAALQACSEDTRVIDLENCGNSIINPGEECDGSVPENATCTSAGYSGGELSCTSTCKLDYSACEGFVAACGDGIRSGAEECDLSDFGDLSCGSFTYYGGQLHCNADCTVSLTECISAGKCGDGTIQDAENCDGANLNSQSCKTLGYYGGTLACSPTCGWDLSGCEGSCGDGIKQGTEQCDGADTGGQSCFSLNYYGGNLGCNSDCTLALASCQSYGTCGDNAVNASFGEQCDGANLGGQACTSLGYYGGTLACNSSCGWDLSGCEGSCGDGVKQAAEQCDGADSGGQSCISLGYYGGTLGCNPDCTLALASCQSYGTCGDNAINVSFGEQCDGSNLGGANCTTAGFNQGTLSCDTGCSFDISQCYHVPECGDGLKEGTEQCDGADTAGALCQDVGIANGTVSCRSDCTLNYSACVTYHQWGTSAEDRAMDIGRDPAGNFVIIGSSYGNFLGNTNSGSSDCFVMKVAPSGTVLWAYLYGTTGTESPWGLKVLDDGNILVGGMSTGNFPDHVNQGLNDAFLMKLDTSGNLIWRRYFATSGADGLSYITTDTAGNIYASGTTTGAFPSFSNSGGTDLFFVKVDPDGVLLDTFQWGAAGTDGVPIVIPTAGGDLLVSGVYSGSLYGDSPIGGMDLGLTLFDASHNTLWSTLYGTSQDDFAYKIVPLSDGTLGFAGKTYGSFYGNSNRGDVDLLVYKMDSTGNLVWSDQLGSGGPDALLGLATGPDDHLYSCGSVSGSILGTPYRGSYDIILVSHTDDGVLRFVRSYGTSGWDRADKLFVDENNNIWITGFTSGALPGNSYYGNMDVMLIQTYGGD
ncbi:hypothetical protein KKF84_06915 [Myxococcota bacterium]|nr:hypothetical protein [Myxococcota bacterium]MBU1535032.1 hypothetical protein [Myxococcota bacterium]